MSEGLTTQAGRAGVCARLTLSRSFGAYGPDYTPLDVQKVERRVMKVVSAYDKIDSSSVSDSSGPEQRERRSEAGGEGATADQELGSLALVRDAGPRAPVLVR